MHRENTSDAATTMESGRVDSIAFSTPSNPTSTRHDGRAAGERSRDAAGDPPVTDPGGPAHTNGSPVTPQAAGTTGAAGEAQKKRRRRGRRGGKGRAKGAAGDASEGSESPAEMAATGDAEASQPEPAPPAIQAKEAPRPAGKSQDDRARRQKDAGRDGSAPEGKKSQQQDRDGSGQDGKKSRDGSGQDGKKPRDGSGQDGKKYKQARGGTGGSDVKRRPAGGRDGKAEANGKQNAGAAKGRPEGRDRRLRRSSHAEPERKPGGQPPTASLWAGWSAARFGGGAHDDES